MTHDYELVADFSHIFHQVDQHSGVVQPANLRQLEAKYLAAKEESRQLKALSQAE